MRGGAVSSQAEDDGVDETVRKCLDDETVRISLDDISLRVSFGFWRGLLPGLLPSHAALGRGRDCPLNNACSVATLHLYDDIKVHTSTRRSHLLAAATAHCAGCWRRPIQRRCTRPRPGVCTRCHRADYAVCWCSCAGVLMAVLTAA